MEVENAIDPERGRRRSTPRPAGVPSQIPLNFSSLPWPASIAMASGGETSVRVKSFDCNTPGCTNTPKSPDNS